MTGVLPRVRECYLETFSAVEGTPVLILTIRRSMSAVNRVLSAFEYYGHDRAYNLASTIERGAGFKVFANLLAGRALMIAPVSAWRLPKLTFECAIEGSFRFVSDVGGDFRNASRCPFE